MQWLKRFLKNDTKAPHKRVPQVFFINTLSGAKEVFTSHVQGAVSIYSCGPTAYAPAHIGNLRAAFLPDTIARVLAGAGYQVRQVINITDFGHLVFEGDEGEDKMTKGLKREGLKLTLENMRAMAEKYAAAYVRDLTELGIDTERIIFPRASDYIPQQIALIKTLEEKGYAYRTSDGVYFDTEQFHGYGILGGITPEEQQESARMKQHKEKRNAADFVLWKPDQHLGWESPWGRGFPGWHVECSAMSRTLLGVEIDIHTGGEDLKAIHHNNEIAQSEAASGRVFSHYWMHAAFLTAANGEKAAKSLGNVVYFSDITDKGFHPLSLRYFYLQAHYRTPLSFSWDALEGAAVALNRLWKISREIAEESKRTAHSSDAREYFLATMRDDLATPQALGILWDALKSEDYTPEEKWGLLAEADAHLGLSFINPPEIDMLRSDEVPKDISEMLVQREAARAAKNFEEADHLRDEIEKGGYRVEDGAQGQVLTRKTL